MNLYAMCAVEAGLDTISLVARSTPINGVIGLAPGPDERDVAGYVDVESFCRRHGLTHIPVESYSLKNDGDRALLEGLQVDVLLVAGWQRLIPDWLIKCCRIGAVGAHGSAEGITRGRGRSPQNWALILGKKQFEISIFFIDAGIDSGKVIDTRVFPLVEQDDIRTSYYKASWCVAEMFVEAVRSERLVVEVAKPQVHGDARYLPQRLPEDGALDWSRSTREVCDFVRALTRPYPGAFCSLEGHQLQVWAARPFDTGTSAESMGVPGEILAVMIGGELVIRSGDGCVIVDDYTVGGERELGERELLLSPGHVLRSQSFSTQLARVLDRHRAKHPALRVVEELEVLAGQGGSRDH